MQNEQLMPAGYWPWAGADVQEYADGCGTGRDPSGKTCGAVSGRLAVSQGIYSLRGREDSKFVTLGQNDLSAR